MLAAATLLAILLLIAAGWDIHSREIPNWLNLVIALTAPLAWWAQGYTFYPDIAWQIGTATAVFGAFVGLFFLGGIGGGDVKMIGALALWIDFRLILPLLMVMALAGGIIAAAMLIREKFRKSEAKPEVPYGAAIAIAGFWAIHQQFINHLPTIPSS